MTTASNLDDVTVGYSSLATRLAALPAAADLGGASLVVVVQTGDADATVGLASDQEAQVEALRDGGAQVAVLRSRGVAKSRNEVLRQATTRYLLFCDDDVQVDLDGLARAVQHLRETGAALAYGRAVDEHGELRKRYVQETAPLTMYNSAKAATYEMVVDVEQVRGAGVWFDERFGAGAELYLGDEYIFIADLLRAGRSADAVPITVAMHPADSSGARWSTGEDLVTRAAALERAFGSRATLPKLGFAWKNRRRFPSLSAIRSFVFTSHAS